MSNSKQSVQTDVWSQRTGYVRLSHILAPAGPLPIGRSTWWQGVRDGRYPKPVKLGPRITAWRVADVLKLIEQGVA
ncbi:putative DNA-binding transcriptional regulator AlpA [Bradyrhizobium japonicum USDA 38]|uniref:helix-turn-helix transcriptional regulator n=1 Tax=Bradyrhizobium japonicum TaxID=375 RepID=UPI00048679E3|nr:AlpA family phage regulatory protein [Bradyrhizobium japonicum]MCS3896256.1 putative DNA-binding transcriptional regulator AlpA [Bradyrhizobium japonicum USDA 38]MCS3948770.1 putative DNA-binding transcriptional regulator AlpA [Bradyrhizobium japonicum]